MPASSLGPAARSTAADIAAANDVDLSKLRDPQPDSARAKDPNVRRPPAACRLAVVQCHGLARGALQLAILQSAVLLRVTLAGRQPAV